MAEAVASAANFRYVMSSTKLIDGFSQSVRASAYNIIQALGDSRLQSNDIAKKLTFVPLGSTHLTRGIDQLHTGHPFIHRKIDFSGKIVNVTSESGHDLSQSGIRLWAHGFDDILRPFLVETTDRGNCFGSICVLTHDDCKFSVGSSEKEMDGQQSKSCMIDCNLYVDDPRLLDHNNKQRKSCS